MYIKKIIVPGQDRRQTLACSNEQFSSKFCVPHECLKANPVLVFGGPTLSDPGIEILALADIKRLKLVTPVRNRFNADASDSNTTTDRETL